jgi:hypothetical protein
MCVRFAIQLRIQPSVYLTADSSRWLGTRVEIKLLLPWSGANKGGWSTLAGAPTTFSLSGSPHSPVFRYDLHDLPQPMMNNYDLYMLPNSGMILVVSRLDLE